MRYRMAPANVTIAAKTSPPAMTHTAKGFARIPELVLNPCSIATISTLRNQQRERDSLFSKSARTLPRKARNRSPRLNVIVESNWPKSDTFKSGLHPSALFPQTRRSWSSYAGGGRGHARLVRRTQAEGRVRRASQRPSRRAPGHRQGPGHSVGRLSSIGSCGVRIHLRESHSFREAPGELRTVGPKSDVTGHGDAGTQRLSPVVLLLSRTLAEALYAT